MVVLVFLLLSSGAELVESQPESVSRRCRIEASCLVARSEPSTDGKRLDCIDKGTVLVILEQTVGEEIHGNSTWYRVVHRKNEITWVSAHYVTELIADGAQSAKVPLGDENAAGTSTAGREQEAKHTIVEEDVERKGRGTKRWPYRFLPAGRISNGGCPGYSVGGVGDFDARLARTQLRSLHKNYGVEVVISLSHRGSMKRVGKRVARETDGALRQESLKLYLDARNYERNVKTFEYLGELSQRNSLYIHCLHGTHRAVLAMIGALIASGQVKTLGEAMRRADGRLKSFKPAYARPFFKQIVRYALQKGVDVEDVYRDFAGESLIPAD